MTLTDEQVRAWRAQHDDGVAWEDGCDCPHCADERIGYQIATEVLAQRERRCGTCAHWTPLPGHCGEGHETGAGWVPATWGCAARTRRWWRGSRWAGAPAESRS